MGSFLWTLDRLGFFLLPQKVFQGILIIVLEFLGIELPALRFQDVARELKHVLGDCFVGNIIEICFLVAHFVGKVKRDAYRPAPRGFSAMTG